MFNKGVWNITDPLKRNWNWNNWNALLWLIVLLAYVFGSFIHFLSEAIGEASRHLRELVGSPSAELSEGEPLVELRSAEGGVGLSVGLAHEEPFSNLTENTSLWARFLSMALPKQTLRCPFGLRERFMVSWFMKVVTASAGWAYGRQNRWNGTFCGVDGAKICPLDGTNRSFHATIVPMTHNSTFVNDLFPTRMIIWCIFAIENKRNEYKRHGCPINKRSRADKLLGKEGLVKQDRW